MIRASVFLGVLEQKTGGTKGSGLTAPKAASCLSVLCLASSNTSSLITEITLALVISLLVL